MSSRVVCSALMDKSKGQLIPRRHRDASREVTSWHATSFSKTGGAQRAAYFQRTGELNPRTSGIYAIEFPKVSLFQISFHKMNKNQINNLPLRYQVRFPPSLTFLQPQPSRRVHKRIRPAHSIRTKIRQFKRVRNL